MTDKYKDINERNAEFWAARKKRDDELLAHLPTAKLSFAMYQTHVKQTSFAQQKPYDFALEAAANLMNEHAEALRSAVNSAHGSAPRSRKKPTHRNLVIPAMQRAIREHMTLSQFLAQMAEEHRGIEIRPVIQRGVSNLYMVFCAEMVPIEEDDMTAAKAVATKKFSLKALEGWFTAARKP